MSDDFVNVYMKYLKADLAAQLEDLRRYFRYKREEDKRVEELNSK